MIRRTPARDNPFFITVSDASSKVNSTNNPYSRITFQSQVLYPVFMILMISRTVFLQVLSDSLIELPR